MFVLFNSWLGTLRGFIFIAEVGVDFCAAIYYGPSLYILSVVLIALTVPSVNSPLNECSNRADGRDRILEDAGDDREGLKD